MQSPSTMTIAPRLEKIRLRSAVKIRRIRFIGFHKRRKFVLEYSDLGLYVNEEEKSDFFDFCKVLKYT